MRRTDSTPRRGTQVQQPSLCPQTSAQLMVVEAATVLHAGTYKWTYQVKPAVADGDAPYGAVVKDGHTGVGKVGQRALSISEMGNNTTHVAGGIPLSSLPAGFAPVRLHDGCAVWCVGCKDEDGLFYWAILSPTQAISGEC